MRGAVRKGFFPPICNSGGIVRPAHSRSLKEARASPQQTREDKRKIKELERDLRRKEKALAEAAALLVLAKKVSAIFHEEEEE